MLYTAGIVADDVSTGVKGQTEQILATVGRLLAANGSGNDCVLSATIYMTDLGRKAEMNEAWLPFFGDHLPARATVGVADLGPNVLVEISVVAVKGS